MKRYRDNIWAKHKYFELVTKLTPGFEGEVLSFLSSKFALQHIFTRKGSKRITEISKKVAELPHNKHL